MKPSASLRAASLIQSRFSYLHIPKLLLAIEGQASPSLAMGFVMETMPVDSSQASVCDFCKPCEKCLQDEELNSICSQFPGMSLGGCIMVLQQCHLFNEGEDGAECVQKKFNEIMRVSQYFGSMAAPRWFLGMGWVFGRRIVDYIWRNVENLKKRGAADVQLGHALFA
ncbi:unnamed protein product [Prorocentrum cordatum]|uniref:Uncharacterized protein n=1 Tax=Prorocentrum cordatum TaxID=2364126 RepID=A0ABN9UYX8_9DINO|nr:unnamed protein product [Polarella glacialis]